MVDDWTSVDARIRAHSLVPAHKTIMVDDWTPGDARMWARRLRKVGFSPVTLHHDSDGTHTGWQGGWYLRCNWPYEIADLPLDLIQYLAYRNIGDYYYEDWREIQWARNPAEAQRLLAAFRAVRLGMGSRPLPVIDTVWEPQFIPTERLWWRFDWPLETQQHPDYNPDHKPGS